MRLGFDARLWHHTGIGRYIHNLLPRLARQVELVVWALPEDVAAVAAAVPRATVLPCPARPFSIAEQLFFFRALRGPVVDLFHSPHLNVPLGCPVPLVVTIHDLIPMRFPGTINSRLGGIYFTFMADLASRRAEEVLTDSENTRRDLVELLHTPPEKIRAIPLAADAAFGVPATPERRRAVRDRFGLDGRYVLYSGQWKAYKNLGVLLMAFAVVHARHPDLKLVLVGREDPTQAHVPALIQQLGLGAAVVTTGYIPDEEDLVALYQEASVFAFPSRYEGFGLPPLEAMAAGVPVVSSDAASLSEVVGDAALVLPPDDPGPWAEAIERLLADQALRDRLIQIGYARAQSLSWDETARRTLEAYEAVLGADRRE
jgi:glycosyltransferase involved in cell wall biosynthesis